VPRVEDWAKTFIAAYHPESATEPRMLTRLIKRFGPRRLDEVSHTDLEQLFRDREHDGAAQGTLERERVSIGALFRAALNDDLLKRDPTEGLKAYRPEPRARVMSADEEQRLRAVLPPHWNRILTVYLTTGLRSSELRLARPCDLRSEGHAIWVRPESNKTRKGRLVPLRDEAQTALREQLATHTDQSTERCYWRVSKNALHQAMTRACADLHIVPTITVHDLRRTFGTRCARAGMHPPHLQRIMGHTDIRITMKYYVHLDEVDLRDALLKIDF
jgi:integrase